MTGIWLFDVFLVLGCAYFATEIICTIKYWSGGA
jgi:hypothetical protein